MVPLLSLFLTVAGHIFSGKQACKETHTLHSVYSWNCAHKAAVNKQTKEYEHTHTQSFSILQAKTPRPGCVQVWSISPCLRRMLISRGGCQFSRIRLHLSLPCLGLSASICIYSLQFVFAQIKTLPRCIYLTFQSLSASSCSRYSSHPITTNHVFPYALTF